MRRHDIHMQMLLKMIFFLYPKATKSLHSIFFFFQLFCQFYKVGYHSSFKLASHILEYIRMKPSNNWYTKELNRELEPYEFVLVNALREYHYVLGQGLLTIASALFRWKCDQTKCDIRKGQNIFFSFIKAPFGDLNAFLKCTWNKNLFHL